MKKRSASTESRLSVHVIPVDGPQFVTIGPDNIGWKPTFEQGWDLRGTKFVRLQPPEHATEQDIARVRAVFEQAGVVVQVEGVTRPQVVTDQATVKLEDKGARETVEKMVEEANTRDRDALSKMCQEILVEVGL